MVFSQVVWKSCHLCVVYLLWEIYLTRLKREWSRIMLFYFLNSLFSLWEPSKTWFVIIMILKLYPIVSIDQFALCYFMYMVVFCSWGWAVGGSKPKVLFHFHETSNIPLNHSSLYITSVTSATATVCLCVCDLKEPLSLHCVTTPPFCPPAPLVVGRPPSPLIWS